MESLNQIRAQMREQIVQALDGVLEERLAVVADAARREQTAALNNALRRLKQADTREIWTHTLLDAAAPFCGEAAVFALSGKTLRFEGGRGVADAPGAEIPLASSPAFVEAIESRDTLVVAGTARELSEPISGLLGDASGCKVYLFPLLERGAAVAVLCAKPTHGRDVDVSALELLTVLAAASIEWEETVVESKPENLVSIAAAPPPPTAKLQAAAPEHLQAQRFARVRVADIVLRSRGALRDGRASKNLYGRLRVEIDAARQAYRRQFGGQNPSVPDYFHTEVVNTLAKGDASLLGPDYPGPLS